MGAGATGFQLAYKAEHALKDAELQMYQKEIVMLVELGWKLGNRAAL